VAVVNVKRDWSKGRAPAQLGGSSAAKVYTVLLDGNDSTDDAPFVARRATGIPRAREIYSESEPYLRCTGVHPAPLSPLLWEVTCEYGVISETSADHPLDEPMKLSIRSHQEQVETDQDADGKAILNTANQPITLKKDHGDDVLTIKRNEASFSFSKMGEYRNTVNANPYRGAPAGTCRMVDVQADEVMEETDDGTVLFYWAVTYVIHYRADRDPLTDKMVGWRRRHLNQGTMHINPSTGKAVKNVTEDKGDVISEPVPLDVNGYPKEGLHKDSSAGDHWLSTSLYPSKDWTPLHLE